MFREVKVYVKWFIRMIVVRGGLACLAYDDGLTGLMGCTGHGCSAESEMRSTTFSPDSGPEISQPYLTITIYLDTQNYHYFKMAWRALCLFLVD